MAIGYYWGLNENYGRIFVPPAGDGIDTTSWVIKIPLPEGIFPVYASYLGNGTPTSLPSNPFGDTLMQNTGGFGISQSDWTAPISVTPPNTPVSFVAVDFGVPVIPLNIAAEINPLGDFPHDQPTTLATAVFALYGANGNPGINSVLDWVSLPLLNSAWSLSDFKIVNNTFPGTEFNGLATNLTANGAHRYWMVAYSAIGVIKDGAQQGVPFSFCFLEFEAPGGGSGSGSFGQTQVTLDAHGRPVVCSSGSTATGASLGISGSYDDGTTYNQPAATSPIGPVNTCVSFDPQTNQTLMISEGLPPKIVESDIFAGSGGPVIVGPSPVPGFYPFAARHDEQSSIVALCAQMSASASAGGNLTAFMSYDGGQTFAAAGVIVATNLAKVGRATLCWMGDTLIAAVPNASFSVSIYVSEDQGQTWTLKGDASIRNAIIPCIASGHGDLYLAAWSATSEPAPPQPATSTTLVIKRSSDLGATWTGIPGPPTSGALPSTGFLCRPESGRLILSDRFYSDSEGDSWSAVS